MNADEKKCPSCAETIKAEAKVCKHCGHNFETGEGAGQHVFPPPPQKTSKMKGCLIVAGALVGIGVLGAIFGGDKGTSASGAQAQASEEAPIAVTARELAAAYEANEAAAQQRYGDHRLAVTGTIASIDLDFADKPFLVLQGNNLFQGPQAHLSETSQARASSLSKGQKASLICSKASEVVGTPMLENCELQ